MRAAGRSRRSGRRQAGTVCCPGLAGRDCLLPGQWPGVAWMTSGWYVLIGPEGFGGAMNPLPPTPISSPRSRLSRRRLLAGAGACLLAAGTTGALPAVEHDADRELTSVAFNEKKTGGGDLTMRLVVVGKAAE